VNKNTIFFHESKNNTPGGIKAEDQNKLYWIAPNISVLAFFPPMNSWLYIQILAPMI
jgi:hypothetical protein